MSLTIEVSLLSGRTVSLEAGPEESVDTLRRRAQETLASGRGRLLNSAGKSLDGEATLKESGLQSGDALTWQMSTVQVRGIRFSSAFAAVLGDGSVMAVVVGGSSGDLLAQMRGSPVVPSTLFLFMGSFIK